MQLTRRLSAVTGYLSRLSPVRRAWALSLLALLIGVTGVAASAGFGSAEAGEERSGVRVPEELVGVLAQAALSCPALTASRLAGQLMAESGFTDQVADHDGGEAGIARFTAAEWEQWRPWPDAEQDDRSANVVALAHHMCDLAGRLRDAGITADPWTLSLAAHDQGLSAVVAEAGVPEAAEPYVAEVSEFTAWYTDTTDFASSSSSEPVPGPSGLTPSGSVAPEPVPDAYVVLINAAGSTCPQVGPAKLAGQLMAVSAFNPDLLGADGGQGIAQFLPSVWERYGRAGESPWEPKDAVGVLARAMCTLVKDLDGLAGDPYPAALAALEWGPASLSEQGGAADGPAVKAYADRVLAYSAYYTQDKRLGSSSAGGTSTTPSATPKQQPSPKADKGQKDDNAAADKPAPTGTTTRTTATAKATNSTAKLTGTQIYGFADKCIYAASASDGQRLAIRTCDAGAASQRWSLQADGTVRHQGRCIDLAADSSANGTAVQLFVCNGTDAQKFELNGSHDLVNTVYGKCVDVAEWDTSDGAVLQLWDCNGGSNQKWFRR